MEEPHGNLLLLNEHLALALPSVNAVGKILRAVLIKPEAAIRAASPRDTVVPKLAVKIVRTCSPELRHVLEHRRGRVHLVPQRLPVQFGGQVRRDVHAARAVRKRAPVPALRERDAEVCRWCHLA